MAEAHTQKSCGQTEENEDDKVHHDIAVQISQAKADAERAHKSKKIQPIVLMIWHALTGLLLDLTPFRGRVPAI